MYHNLLFHSPDNGHLGYFKFFTITSNTSINTPPLRVSQSILRSAITSEETDPKGLAPKVFLFLVSTALCNCLPLSEVHPCDLLVTNRIWQR